MAVKKFSNKKTISYYMCDRTHTLTLPMLVNLILEVSGEQSDELGLDEQVMEEKGYSWIILQYEFHITRFPHNKETIEIETYATEYNKLFCYRDFVVRDEEGTELIHVQSTFALFDSAKRKMARLPEDIVTPYEATFNKRVRRTPKPVEINEEKVYEQPFNVRYFDIDTNQHVNNSKYLDWTLSTLGGEFLSQHTMTYANVKFDKEVYEGKLINSSVSIDETEDHIITAHKIRTEDIINCSASFEWKKQS
ncbi:acyl-[acyl-carrier-protein] thioesterase [Marinilactibacillus kalidii]|uniref:acyl-[acyl-carrier-protein] thioesterase n=1 Tax=Marinilactibacillus kalidii TaxID=2820274 RepID=UPI001ABE0A05|nr:acyl-ACP thioesterase domain-containing protein [Marinilactibacillus kalidii]